MSGAPASHKGELRPIAVVGEMPRMSIQRPLATGIVAIRKNSALRAAYWASVGFCRTECRQARQVSGTCSHGVRTDESARLAHLGAGVLGPGSSPFLARGLDDATGSVFDTNGVTLSAVQAVPEPSSFVLFLVGGIGGTVVYISRRRAAVLTEADRPARDSFHHFRHPRYKVGGCLHEN